MWMVNIMNGIVKIVDKYASSGITLNGTVLSIYTPIVLIVKILIILVIMYLAVKIGNGMIRRTVERQKKLKFSLDERKAKTVASLLKSILKYIVYFFGIFAIINEIFSVVFGKGLALALGGVVGVAVGFGAQSLIKDVINGIFILFEDQFAVGDYVDIEGKSGVVESVEIRITKIRDFNGDLHIIPNGLISKVTNHSRGNVRILFEVEIAYEEDIDKAIKVITDICEVYKDGNEDIAEGPKVLGVSEVSQNCVKIKVFAKVKPMTQWDIEMNLKKDIKNGIQKANIKVPCQNLRIVKGE